MSYLFRPDSELDQGDLIRRIVVARKSPSDLTEPPDLLISNVIVLSHGCDIDKPRFDSVLVARVIRLSAVSDQGTIGNIQRNRIYEAFYLPAVEPLNKEAYIDWRTIQAIDKRFLFRQQAR